jgi:hypothetical protein
MVYEDRHLVVVDKPAGMVVHPAAGNPDGTLVNALLYHCGDLAGIGVGGQGIQDMLRFADFPEIQIVAVCDVQRQGDRYMSWNWSQGKDTRLAGREPARRAIEAKYAKQKGRGKYQGCHSYADYRELLDKAKYAIDFYQREYAWKERQVRELIEHGHVDFGESRMQHFIQFEAQVADFLERHRELGGRGGTMPEEVRWHFIGHDVFNWVRLAFFPHIPAPPEITGTETLMTVLLSMLGLGGLRTIEKLKGVSREKWRE